MTHSPHQISVDENDIRSQFLSIFRNNTLRFSILDNDTFDRCVESELGSVAFGDFGESFGDDRETSERVEDTFAVFGILKQVVSTESVER